MGPILHYLFSFEGRISRTKWWLSQFLLIGLVIGWAVISFGPSDSGAMIFGTTIVSNAPREDVLRQSFAFEDKTADAVEAEAPKQQNSFYVAFLLLAVPYCWIWLAVTAKRLHDLGMSGWFGVPGLAPTLLYGMIFVLSNAFTDMYLITQLGPLLMVGQVVQSIAGLWLMSQCGFRKGSANANEYGPPGSPVASASASHDKEKSFDREDLLIRAAIARMHTPAEPVVELPQGPQKPVFGRRG
jgi:uncharacterized membrane protein YhaH (DUF805 family)